MTDTGSIKTKEGYEVSVCGTLNDPTCAWLEIERVSSDDPRLRESVGILLTVKELEALMLECSRMLRELV